MSFDRSTLNRQRALAEIRNAGTIGRADLARRMGLSVQAVSNITDVLTKSGMICEAGRREGGRGLPVVLYGLAPDGAYSVGFEIRPTALYCVVIDQTGAVREQTRIPLADPAPGPVLAALADHMERLAPYVPRMIGAGIVRPGPFGSTGFSLTANELPGWELPDLHARLEEAVGMDVTLDNDATAGAAAEHLAGQHSDDFAYLYFGTGLGLGIISRGVPLSGAFGNSGEIGALRLQGLDHPLEQHLSRAALQSALAADGHTAQSIDEIAALHATANPSLDRWITGAARALGLAVGVIETLFDPATVVLGGAMPASVLQSLMERCTLPPDTIAVRPDRSLPRLRLGTCGPFTVSTGAAALVLNAQFQGQRLP